MRLSVRLAEHVDVAASVPAISDLVLRHACQHPDLTAFRFEGVTTSFAELEKKIDTIAAALDASGIGGGDHICYLGKNSAVFFFLLFAAARAGAVMVPIGWRLAPAEVKYIVGDTGARLLFHDRDHAGLAADAVAALSKSPERIGIEDDKDWTDWLARGAGEAPPPTADHPDRAFIQLYTSGTTGRPRGVMLSARNFYGMRVRCRDIGVDWDQWTQDDVALIAMPVSHVGGAGYGIMTLFHGATGLVMREFSPQGLLRSISDDRVSKFFIVPTALQMAIRDPLAAGTDFSRIRHILYGASPMPLPLLVEALAVIGAGMCQQYGMTETAGTVVALEPRDHDPEGNSRMRSAGRPLPGVDVKIVDTSGEIVPLGTIGEIMLRSDANMLGYWNLPDETAATIDTENWLRTGDAGYLDADGYVFICDRVKDMICSGGENVYAAEVESVLFGHPSVSEAAVIGVPHDKWGEAVKAIVVLRPGETLLADDLLAWTRQSLAGYKVPKSVDFVLALPKNPAGKVLKYVLRKPYWARHERMVN